MSGPTDDLPQRNKAAWAHLYGSTTELVWGSGPVGFLEPFLQPELTAGRTFARILDAAAGEGRNLGLLRRLGHEVTACDGSAEALAKIPPAHAEGVERVCCDLATTPFADGRFDFILMSDLIETLPAPLPVLREMHRLLSPGGRLVCNIPGPEDEVAGVGMTIVGPNTYLYRDAFFYRFYEGGEARRLLAAAGFRVLREDVRHWREAPHPEFRGQTHAHTSRVFLVERVRPAA